MANESFKAGEGALWVQPNGPNSAPQYLGCHSLADIAEPKGDITLLFCPDEAATGKFKVSGSWQSAAGPITTTITTKVNAVADYLESLACAVPIYLTKQKCGRRDVFGNYSRIYVIDGAVITNATLSAMLAMSPDDEGESMQAFDISGQALLRYWQVKALRQSTTDTEGQLAVAFLKEDQCASACGSAVASCAVGFVGGKTVVGSAANQAEVLKTTDGGGTWAAASAKPFSGGYAIAALLYFAITGTLKRLLAGNGTTQASNPAQIAYSDDSGTTWTQVNVGSTNAQYFLSARSLFKLNQYNIWAVTSSGYIYQSQDGGVSWTTRDAGIAASAANLWAVSFADALHGAASGASNTILKTSDAGVTWSVVTGPSAEAANIGQVVDMVDTNVVWVGYSDGKLYYTSNFQDTTPTWTLRSLGITATSVKDIQFINSLTGYVVANVSGPIGHLLRTFDGGYTWEDITTPTNVGLNSIEVCSVNSAFAVGEASGGSGVILKVS